MTTTQIILVVAIIAVVAFLAARGWGGGPRVTQIDIRRDREKDSHDA